MENKQGKILFIPHGGGPLPLLNDAGHNKMVEFLKRITSSIGKPSVILVISAHWEEDIVSITSADSPSLIYDYYGFPEESYNITYPVQGSPVFAEKIYQLLQQQDIEVKKDIERGLDHGVFVPLKIMYPDADVPCVQLSLHKSLEPQLHINIGKALSELRNENVLILGSGFSFHNLRALMSNTVNQVDEDNVAFEEWLIDTCTNQGLTTLERENRLKHWSEAPSARYCHPREEHLLPLHVCAGMASAAAELVFSGDVAGKKTSAFLW